MIITTIYAILTESLFHSSRNTSNIGRDQQKAITYHIVLVKNLSVTSFAVPCLCNQIERFFCVGGIESIQNIYIGRTYAS